MSWSAVSARFRTTPAFGQQEALRAARGLRLSREQQDRPARRLRHQHRPARARRRRCSSPIRWWFCRRSPATPPTSPSAPSRTASRRSRTRTSRPARCRCRMAVTTISLPGGEYKRGYIQSYNLSLQRELPHSFVGSVAYVGHAHPAREPAVQHQRGESRRRQQWTAAGRHQRADGRRDVHRAARDVVLQRPPGAARPQLFERPAGEGVVYLLQDNR